ncbi:MAG: isochorismatase family cysteine hydrolase [Candidatus Zixiibacteriota bacterium]
MKTKYYTINNIDKQARAYIDELASFRKYHSIDLKRKNIALLVIDMQKYFTDPESHAMIPSAPAIMPKIKQLQDYFISNNLEVLQTRHINNERNAKMMDKWWSDVITKGNPLSEICDDLKDKRIKPVIKSQYDAFHETNLDSEFKAKNIKQVVITGVATHLCCETTARSAFMRGFEVFLAVDCIATWREDFHRATLLNISHGFAVPVLSSEIILTMERK